MRRTNECERRSVNVHVIVSWSLTEIHVAAEDGVGLLRVLAQAQGASWRVNILLSGPSLGLGPIDLHIRVRVRV